MASTIQEHADELKRLSHAQARELEMLRQANVDLAKQVASLAQERVKYEDERDGLRKDRNALYDQYWSLHREAHACVMSVFGPVIPSEVDRRLSKVTEKFEKQTANIKELLAELSEYKTAYPELEKAANAACDKTGISRPSEPTKHRQIVAVIESLVEAALNDTTDTRIKELEQVCYSAEARSGVMCREENPWRRVRYVLENMAAEIVRAKTTLSDATFEQVKQRVWAIGRNLGATDRDTPSSNDLWPTLHVLEGIEKRAMDGQNIKAACLKLKELL